MAQVPAIYFRLSAIVNLIMSSSRCHRIILNRLAFPRFLTTWHYFAVSRNHISRNIYEIECQRVKYASAKSIGEMNGHNPRVERKRVTRTLHGFLSDLTGAAISLPVALTENCSDAHRNESLGARKGSHESHDCAVINADYKAERFYDAFARRDIESFSSSLLGVLRQSAHVLAKGRFSYRARRERGVSREKPPPSSSWSPP